MNARSVRCIGVLLGVASAATACGPTTIAEAEAKGDVAWLDQNGTPDAVAAMGRLADRAPKAASALAGRSSYDVNAFRAAWAAVQRDAPWGTTVMRNALSDPKRADLAASAMAPHDAHDAAFLADLDEALVRLSAGTQNFNVSSILASIGVPAHATVQKRLVDASTRGAMCRGIASDNADGDARRTLLDVPDAARDAAACVDAVVRVAAVDDTALAWLAERGEPGILGAAGKDDTLPCSRLHVAWVKVFAARPRNVYSALVVPLAHALKRCPGGIDGVLADSLARRPEAHAMIVEAIDPWEDYGRSLGATCAALPAVVSGHDTPVVRERASDALVHLCKMPG